MKYKLLAEKGIHFVCLEDGTRLPFQIRTEVVQRMREAAIVTVSAYADRMMGAKEDSRLEYDAENKRVLLNGKALGGLKMLNVAHYGLLQVEFTVECEVCDTVEKPINLNRY